MVRGVWRVGASRFRTQQDQQGSFSSKGLGIGVSGLNGFSLLPSPQSCIELALSASACDLP